MYVQIQTSYSKTIVRVLKPIDILQNGLIETLEDGHTWTQMFG